MKYINRNIASLLLIFLIPSCSDVSVNNISDIISNSSRFDGNTVTLYGTIRVNSGFYNIFPRDGRSCIGLLLTNAQRQESARLEGRRVLLTGILESRGCADHYICNEHLCGPELLTHVEFLNQKM